ncbi:hypothetical protein [Bifidobacterium aemilianum]|nr:hypothetical protein [Bifidobacterium aemilianum]
MELSHGNAQSSFFISAAQMMMGVSRPTFVRLAKENKLTVMAVGSPKRA